jgi:hypothetical protein
VFRKTFGSWPIPGDSVISGSRLISRACVAHCTANELLLDRPGRGFWYFLGRFISLAVIPLCLISQPERTALHASTERPVKQKILVNRKISSTHQAY